MSAMVLLLLGMERGVREEACAAWMCRPSMQSKRTAGIDFDVRILKAQLTAEVLSQNMPTW
eukprot:14505384-Ditylum_brightwellii.AAC.1